MMKKIFAVTIFLGTTSAFAQQMPDCRNAQNLSPTDQEYCRSQNLRPQQQQSMRASDRARECESLLGESGFAASGPQAPASPRVTRNRQTVTVEGEPPVTTTTENEETVTGGPGPQMATGSTLSTAATTTIYQDSSATPLTPAPVGTPILNPDVVRKARTCRNLQLAAAGTRNQNRELSATAVNYAMDQRISCVQLAGYTADYTSCMNALNMYNNVKMAEAALFVVQSVQAQNNQRNVENQTNQRVAAGDGQNAAYDAQIATTSAASQLNQQKAMAYAAAVAALGSQVQAWIKEDSLPQVLCSGNQGRRPPIHVEGRVAEPPTGVPVVGYTRASAVAANIQCSEAIKDAYAAEPGEMIANKQAKAGFTAALMELIAKGIQAGIAARQLGDISKKVAEAKKQTENPYDAPTFEYCQVNKADPKCAGASTVTPGSGLQDGGFSFGEGFGNNAFNPLTEEDKLGGVEPLPLGDQVVPDATNPFVDDAKTASGILDPAGAASIQPGGAGGGGGGGAPGLGGGSASLGNDTPGVDDSKKENDIKANKADGKYNMAAGGGFQAIKPMKDENPFANLFDGKGGGSLDEDRSIASGDIDGQDSGLFSKISKRYSQIKADGRIEAKNLDE